MTSQDKLRNLYEANKLEQIDNLRRIAERGLRLSQTAMDDVSRHPSARAAHEVHLDLWQHMLDEIERVRA